MNDPPLYPVLMRLWTGVFGLSELSFRLPSALSICGACWAVWLTVRRSLGPWASLFGTAGVFCLSPMVLAYNSQGRLYGLFCLICSVVLFVHYRAARHKATWKVMVALTLTHAALVLCHDYGILYSVSLALATISGDWLSGRRRWGLYASIFLGWLALVPWIPCFRNAAAMASPSWVPVPSMEGLGWMYANTVRVAFLVGMLILFAAFRCWRAEVGQSGGADMAGAPAVSAPQEISHLLLLGVVPVLLVPTISFVISRLWTPIFMTQYMIPGTVGWAVILACLAQWLIAGNRVFRRDGRGARAASRVGQGILWAFILLMAAGPITDAASIPRTPRPGSDFENVYPELPIVTLDHVDYYPRFHYDKAGRKHFWPIDLECAQKSGNPMEMGYYHNMIGFQKYYPYFTLIETEKFLSQHDKFLIIHHGGFWTEFRILSNPAYEVQVLHPNLLLVERKKR